MCNMTSTTIGDIAKSAIDCREIYKPVPFKPDPMLFLSSVNLANGLSWVMKLTG